MESLRPERQDQVKPLHTLTGDVLTTAQVAEWYGVGPTNITTLVQRHRPELESNGMHVLSDQALREFKSQNVTLTARRYLTVFPRRAILNVGMLLRQLRLNFNLSSACPGESLQQELGKALSCELQLTVVPGRGIIP